MSVEEMSAEEVAAKAMNVAADMCIYTNKEFLTLTIDSADAEDSE